MSLRVKIVEKMIEILEDPRVIAAAEALGRKTDDLWTVSKHRIRRASRQAQIRQAQINTKLRRDYGVWESKILVVKDDINLDDQEFASKVENEIARVGLDGWEPYQIISDGDGISVFFKRYTTD